MKRGLLVKAMITKSTVRWTASHQIPAESCEHIRKAHGVKKADLGIYWAKLDDLKTYPGHECAIRARSEAPATKQQK